MSSGKTKSTEVADHFRALSSVATNLNKSSDELTKSVGVLDVALKKLNIGITVWVKYASWAMEPPEYGSDQIGYAKISGKWGIALRSVFGDESRDEESENGPWLFGEAPREMRLRAVDHLPELIENLGKVAFNTAKKLNEKAQQVSELAAVVEQIAKEEDEESRGDQ
jgi:hypothetical protein